VKVRHGEGVANHTGPEPCIAGRKAGGEASAGERIGQPLSRVRIIPGADAVPMAEGNMPSTLTRVLVQPGVVRDVQTLFARKPGGPTSDQWRARRAGPHREGEEP
jgi:hypothetical protein